MSKQNPKQYELLVQHILQAKLLKDCPASDLRFFHNKVYTGRSGHKHRIDVSAELRIAGIEVVIILECKLYSRLLGVDDVLEFAARKEDIAAHKGILVTTFGFQRGAITIAKSKRIALVIVCDLAYDSDWETRLADGRIDDDMSFVRRVMTSWDVKKASDCPKNIISTLSNLHYAKSSDWRKWRDVPYGTLAVEPTNMRDSRDESPAFVLESEMGGISLSPDDLITFFALEFYVHQSQENRSNRT